MLNNFASWTDNSFGNSFFLSLLFYIVLYFSSCFQGKPMDAVSLLLQETAFTSLLFLLYL